MTIADCTKERLAPDKPLFRSPTIPFCYPLLSCNALSLLLKRRKEHPIVIALLDLCGRINYSNGVGSDCLPLTDWSDTND